jgi:hypothetical protein
MVEVETRTKAYKEKGFDHEMLEDFQFDLKVA